MDGSSVRFNYFKATDESLDCFERLFERAALVKLVSENVAAVLRDWPGDSPLQIRAIEMYSKNTDIFDLAERMGLENAARSSGLPHWSLTKIHEIATAIFLDEAESSEGSLDFDHYTSLQFRKKSRRSPEPPYDYSDPCITFGYSNVALHALCIYSHSAPTQAIAEHWWSLLANTPSGSWIRQKLVDIQDNFRCKSMRTQYALQTIPGDVPIRLGSVYRMWMAVPAPFHSYSMDPRGDLDGDTELVVQSVAFLSSNLTGYKLQQAVSVFVNLILASDLKSSQWEDLAATAYAAVA